MKWNHFKQTYQLSAAYCVLLISTIINLILCRPLSCCQHSSDPLKHGHGTSGDVLWFLALGIWQQILWVLWGLESLRMELVPAHPTELGSDEFWGCFFMHGGVHCPFRGCCCHRGSALEEVGWSTAMFRWQTCYSCEYQELRFPNKRKNYVIHI